MRILLATNKTLTSGSNIWVDGGYWNVYLPLKHMGHELFFYDTVSEEMDFDEAVKIFEPELIFCCMTNDVRIAPREPWQQLKKYTDSKEITTFNWFCDETWRFENFSKEACHYFNVCSTPEHSYLKKFREEAKYERIILGLWHANIDLFPKEEVEKIHDVSFCGHLNNDRRSSIDFLKNNNVEVKNFHGLEHREMLKTLAQSKIGINFSKNFNGQNPTLQIKGRMFEVPAAKSLLVTEYAPGLEDYYEIDNEIITFENSTEMLVKLEYLINNPDLAAFIADNGYKRFIKDHESKIRLEKVLTAIHNMMQI